MKTPFPPDHDYAADPSPYKALKTEQGVFTTPPYSANIKPLWRFANQAAATASAQAIWSQFMHYRDQADFIGMDIARKFIQMGRTRSLRYALRRGGRKYDPATGEEMQRTGEVYDADKAAGAEVFGGFLERCWAETMYSEAFEDWKRRERGITARRTHRGKRRIPESGPDANQRESELGTNTRKRKKIELNTEGKEGKRENETEGEGNERGRIRKRASPRPLSVGRGGPESRPRDDKGQEPQGKGQHPQGRVATSRSLQPPGLF